MAILRHRPRVFVCYRHSDAPTHARWLHRELEERWGTDHVFIDDGIRPGSEFPVELERRIVDSTFLLVVIGRDWLANDGRPPRLFDEDDWVRKEILMAMSHGKDIVPVLVESARMPTASDLPDALQRLATRQAHLLTETGWRREVHALAAHLERSMPPSPSPWISLRDSTRGTYVVPMRAIVGRALADPWVITGGVVTAALSAITQRLGVAIIGIAASGVFALITAFDRRVIRGIDARRSLRGRSRS